MDNASLQCNDLLLLLLNHKQIARASTEVINILFNVTGWFVVLNFARGIRTRTLLLRFMWIRCEIRVRVLIGRGRSDHKLLGRIIRLYTTFFGRPALFLIFILNELNRKRLAAFFTNRSFAALSCFQKKVFRMNLHAVLRPGAYLDVRKSQEAESD